MIWEIHNPSDPYTIKSDSFHVAAVAVAMLGGGAYGIDGTPVLLGWDEWLKEQKIEVKNFVEAHRREIADALDSVLIGSENARQEAESAIALMPPEKREAWLAERHERERTSMNDIGAKAKKWAAVLRKGL